MGTFATHARRAHDIYAVGDLRNVLDASQKFLEQLLQVKARHTSAESQLSGIVLPGNLTEDEFVRTAVNAAADDFVDAVISNGSLGRWFHFDSRGRCRSFCEIV
jgi:hypothetical protein